MLAKTGLLIVSNPNQIGKILPCVRQQVKNTLYIQLLSALEDLSTSSKSVSLTAWPKFSKTIFNIYSQVARHCDNIDVKVLLSGFKNNNNKIQTLLPIDVVIFDRSYSKNETDNFIKIKIDNLTKEYDVLTLDSGETEKVKEACENDCTYCHTVLGGTFDRLHLAHKLLLSEAALRTRERVTVGVTDVNMLQGKLLWELIEDITVRMDKVKDFLMEVCPELEYNVVPIRDPFGPAITDSTMEAIVVSSETLKGGQKINQIRQESNLKPLAIIPIDLIEEPNPKPMEEAKISSSTIRLRLLGTLIRPIIPKKLPKMPYIIGLTGGIASGKSNVAKWAAEMGAEIINCDLIGHDVYKNGKPCYKLLVDSFGPEIVGENKEIDRKVLGGIVFSDYAKLELLNSLVWPALLDEIKEIIRKSDNKVIIVEAAVLLKAGWDKECHEVWTTFVPPEEAVKRITVRNNLTEEQAKSRIESQPSNSYYVKSANVVFCTLWEKNQTKEQVEKAWNELRGRM